MKRYQVEIHWNPSTTVEVEAEDQEEAEQLAIDEAEQPEVDSCTTKEISEGDEEDE